MAIEKKMNQEEIEKAKSELTELNTKIAEMEQLRDESATNFFKSLISDQLIFRRADGSVVGKGGSNPDQKGFIDSLSGKNPFVSREVQDIEVYLFESRALVTLIVRTTKADGTQNRYGNIRLFSNSGAGWILEFWYNYDITGLAGL
jgi:hypothetical protein